MSDTNYPETTSAFPFAPEGEDTCEAMTDSPEGENACPYGDGVGYCALTPGHTTLHLCFCTEHTF